VICEIFTVKAGGVNYHSSRIRGMGARVYVFTDCRRTGLFHRRAVMSLKTVLSITLIATALSVPSRHASAVDTDPSPPASGDYAEGRNAIEAKDWAQAIKLLTSAAQRDSRNADVQNLLGYAYRNSGQLDIAFKHYERALQINPRHRGAHEYVGEAYLMVGNLAKAEEHLAALKAGCPRVCEERDDLMRSIERYRARKK